MPGADRRFWEHRHGSHARWRSPWQPSRGGSHPSRWPRICRPGGEVRILEYAYSKDPVRRLVMHLWKPWVQVVYGAAFDRETERYIPGAGLTLVEQRFLYSDIIKLLVATPR